MTFRDPSDVSSRLRRDTHLAGSACSVFSRIDSPQNVIRKPLAKDLSQLQLHQGMPLWLRWSLIISGFLALGLAFLGIVMPGLPTTPFVLLSDACFVRASPQLHQWLLRNKWLGPLIRNWEQHRSPPCKTKLLALGTMLVTVSIAVWGLHGRLYLQLSILVAAAIGAVMVWRIPTRL